MICLEFYIENPWSDRWSTVFFKNGTLPRHKAWEFNCYKTNFVINFNLRFRRRCDHAGLQIELGLLGYELEFSIYDTRHWDYESNRFNN